MDFPGTRFSRGTPRLSRRAFLLGSAQLVAGTAAFLLIRQGADAATVSVKDHGAAGDGVQNDAPEIQKAIDKAPLGATVHFPAGTYALYDALYPRSGVNIEFAPGAKVIQRGVQHIFVFRNVSNIVTRNLRMRHEGSGTIANPMLWDGASHLTHYDTTIERTDAWCGYLKGGSHHITIDGYYVLTANAKTDNIDDGIDFVDCHDITLRKFDIKTNDDAIAFHSWGGGVYNVHIENGYVQSRTSGGVAFGNAISATIRDCTIKNVVARDTRVPVYFKGTEASNTGEVYNISFEDISIFDNIGRTHSGVFFHTVSARAGKAHDISFKDVTYAGPMEFDLFRIQRSKRISVRNAVCNAFRIASPEFGSRNRWGVYIEHSQDCHFEGFNLTGMVAQAMIGGSTTTGNRFVGFTQSKMLTQNGGSLQKQLYGPASPTATPTRTATPPPAVVATPTPTPLPGLTIQPIPGDWIW